MRLFDYYESKPHPLTDKFDDQELLEKVNELSKIQFKVKGLVHNLLPFDPNRKDEKMIEITKLFGEILNEISDYNDEMAQVEQGE